MIMQGKEIHLGEKAYLIGRVDVFDQLAFASDFRDILMALAFLKEKRTSKVTDEAFGESIEFIVTGGLRSIPEDKRDYLVRKCLSQVERKEGIAFAPILNAKGGPQYADIDLPVIIRLLYEFFDHNGLLDFFFARQSSSGETAKSTGQHSPKEKAGSSRR
jgi:hypothetical protein